MKKPVSATIEKDLLEWLERKLSKERLKYRNRSHIIEIALQKLKEEEED